MGIGKDFEDINPICGFSNDLLSIDVSQDLIKFDASQFESENKPDSLDEIFNECFKPIQTKVTPDISGNTNSWIAEDLEVSNIFNGTANKQNDEGLNYGQNKVPSDCHHVYPSSGPQYSTNNQFQNYPINSNNHIHAPTSTQTTKKTDFSQTCMQQNEPLHSLPYRPVPKYVYEQLRQKPLPSLPAMHPNLPKTTSGNVNTSPEKRKFLVNESTLEISSVLKKRRVQVVVDPVEFKRIQTENRALKRKYEDLMAFVGPMLNKKQMIVDEIVKDHAKSIQKRLCRDCKQLKLDDFEYILSSKQQKKDQITVPTRHVEEIRRIPFDRTKRC